MQIAWFLIKHKWVNLRIGIDLMGSDSSPQELFLGVLQAAAQKGVKFQYVVFATAPVIEELSAMTSRNPENAQLHFHAVEEYIEMHEDPLLAVRRKKKSSLRVGMHLLRQRQIDAFVSAGNTGALITCSRVMLPRLPSIRRPALLIMLPTKQKMLAVVDVGGNIKETATSLLQYAYLGIAYQRCCAGIDTPSVGVLNIGAEANKGPALLRQVYAMLESRSKGISATGKKFHFAGNIEARELFDGKIDVLITDGFTGNVLLKAIEGTAAFVLDSLSNQVQMQTQSTLHTFQTRFDSSEHPGALLCGVDGVVVKCHGNASAKSIYSAVCGAISILEKKLIPQIKEDLSLERHDAK